MVNVLIGRFSNRKWAHARIPPGRDPILSTRRMSARPRCDFIYTKSVRAAGVRFYLHKPDIPRFSNKFWICDGGDLMKNHDFQQWKRAEVGVCLNKNFEHAKILRGRQRMRRVSRINFEFVMGATWWKITIFNKEKRPRLAFLNKILNMHKF